MYGRLSKLLLEKLDLKVSSRAHLQLDITTHRLNMDRNNRRDEWGGRRDEPRNQKPRYGMQTHCRSALEHSSNSYSERERSRSPHRERRDERRRSRSPPRGGRNGPAQRQERDYERTAPPRNPRDRQTSKTPEPSRFGGRGPPRNGARPNGAAPQSEKPAILKPEAATRDVQMGNGGEDEDSEAEMARVMGFKDFRTTKNSKVPGNDRNYAVSKVKKAEYRQYMNRVGGFNRPLSPGKGRD
jgi:U4/U6.U5 tri-snRNP-associated protein 3